MKLCSPSTVSTIPAVVSNEIALDALREAAARTTGSLTVALYEKHRAPMHPSVVAVQCAVASGSMRYMTQGWGRMSTRVRLT